MKWMRRLNLISLVFLCGCAVLHHVQVGEIDNRKKYDLKPIEIKVSEMGVDLNDVRNISKGLMDKDSGKKTDEALQFLQYFQMGPHTGAGVYSIEYIKDIQAKLLSQCPNGFLTGILSIRETREYPVIKGEIVKIKAYCAIPEGAGT